MTKLYNVCITLYIFVFSIFYEIALKEGAETMILHDIETAARSELEALQLKRLRATAERVYERVAVLPATV